MKKGRCPLIIRPLIIHNFPIWLPITQTWMYNQVLYLPDNIDTHIVCEKTQCLDQFYLPHIHSLLDQEGRIGYLKDKFLQKIKIRRQVKFLYKKIIETKGQILHSHFGNIGWRNIPTVKKANVRHVVTFYGQDVNKLPYEQPIWKKRYEELFKSADIFLCEGPHMKQCLESLGCPKEKVKVHHLGVEIDKIKFIPRIWNPKDPLKVLIAASFQEKKGIPYALEALGKIQKEVSLEITIIGDANKEKRSQLEKKKILEIIEKYHLRKKIKLLGYQSHSVLLEEAYKNHIFMSPSVVASDNDTEGGAPVSIIEMAATGMMIISTDHCDIPNVIQDEKTGFLAKERDVDGLVQHMKKIIQNSQPEYWLNMEENARSYVQENFNARIQGEKLAAVYKSLC